MCQSCIEVQRVCLFCGVEFTAKTTVTKYCSHRCSTRAHKQRLRKQKVGNTNNETSAKLNSLDSASINNKEFLTVPQAGKLMGVSRFTVYRYLQDNILKCMKLRGKTFIRRMDIETLFDNAAEYKIRKREEPQAITEFYTMKEITEKFKIKESWAFKMIKEKSIPKVTHRGRTMYSKSHVEKSFIKQTVDPTKKEWYTSEEIHSIYGMTNSAIYSFVYEKNIPKKKEGRISYYSKKHFDMAKTLNAPIVEEYYKLRHLLYNG